ncbi:MAG: hypothetical protein L0Z62_26015 [Gemmataceae bacterium]|nr:hypothetical protein [Gemmataceae bacterium]
MAQPQNDPNPDHNLDEEPVKIVATEGTGGPWARVGYRPLPPLSKEELAKLLDSQDVILNLDGREEGVNQQRQPENSPSNQQEPPSSPDQPS